MDKKGTEAVGSARDGGYSEAPPPPYEHYQSSHGEAHSHGVQHPQTAPPPPPPMMNQQPIQPGPVYIQAQPGHVIVQTVPGYMFTPHPTSMTCPHCNQPIVTNVSYESGTLTWLLVGGLCLLGCWMGCCLIPTCIPECQDALHSCPQCNRFIGHYRRM